MTIPRAFLSILLSAAAITVVIAEPPASADAMEVSEETLAKIMSRLDRLETENETLKKEVATFRSARPQTASAANAPAPRKNHGRASNPERDPTAPIATSLISGMERPAATKAFGSFFGAYGGLNVGFGWGMSNGVSTTSLPLYDRINPIFSAQPTTTILMPAIEGVSAFSNTGAATATQSGTQGGLQVGFNWAVMNSFLAGVETDIQGSTMFGSSSYFGHPSIQRQNLSFTCAICSPTFYNYTFNYAGGGNISAGTNWLGTARGRVGFLPVSSLLIYVTGGLAYGSVYASTGNNLVQSVDIYQSNGGAFTPFGSYAETSVGGDGRYSSVRMGYSSGAGVEWLFAGNWGLKAEAIYYNLGTSSFAATPIGITGSTVVNRPITKVTYDGIIGRAGVNYHFNLDY